MQAFFAVAGPPARTRIVFDDIWRLTTASNPSSELSMHESPWVRVGFESRSFQALDLENQALSLFLEGAIRTIDGRWMDNLEGQQKALQHVADTYASKGNVSWDRIDGTFRVVIVDGTTVHASTDISGTRGLYWWAKDGIWACHSHLMDLAPAYPGRLDTDLGAIGHYCSHGRYPPGATPYRQISHVGAGQYISSVNHVMVTRDHYSRAPLPSATPRDGETLAGEFIERAAAAISIGLSGAVKPVIPLSGGVDSRLITALAVREVGRDAVKTITWGEEPDRPGSDAVIARQVASALGIENVWHPKAQDVRPSSFERAVYLSSGETDHAIHYPEDHLLHAELAEDHGYRTIVRGDELFGPVQTHLLMTNRGFLGYSSLHRLSNERAYADLLGEDVFRAIAAEQELVLRRILAKSEAKTPFGKWLEYEYSWALRRGLAPYNVVKNADLEVLNPLLDRPLNEWIRSLPDVEILRKKYVRRSIDRLHPPLRSIPYASANNLPSWPQRWLRDPSLTSFYHDVCSGPGWLDEIGAAGRVRQAIEQIAREGRITRGSSDYRAETRSIHDRSGAGFRMRNAVLEPVRRSRAGRLVAELTLEYRATHRATAQYLRISRLAVLHSMLGEVANRRRSSQHEMSRGTR